MRTTRSLTFFTILLAAGTGSAVAQHKSKMGKGPSGPENSTSAPKFVTT